MILLDTNILSELMRAAPEVAVEQWLADQPAAGVFISAITEAELRYGVALMPSGKRRSALAVEIENMLREDFSGRILPFDSSAAVAFAEIAAERRQADRNIIVPIHAPAGGGDIGESDFGSLYQQFQSTPPRGGGDECSVDTASSTKCSNPRPRGGGRLDCRRARSSGDIVPIHAPAGGGDGGNLARG